MEVIRTGPSVRRGKSKQDYGTPWEFIRACERRFGAIVRDLAAHGGNAKCDRYYDLAADSLSQPWAENDPTGVLWLNPPFANIEPWAAKCAEESAKRHGLILMLTPASTGSDWFAAHVNRRSMVLGLSPRVPFDGTPINPNTGRPDGYPKDLMLTVWGFGLHGFDTWRWSEGRVCGNCREPGHDRRRCQKAQLEKTL